MFVRVLGPVEVEAGAQTLSLPGRAPRLLIALLALRAGREVSADELIAGLWGDDAPAGAAATLQSHVARTRRVVRAESVVTTPRGYRLGLPPTSVDAVLFESGVTRGLALPDPSAQAAALRTALDLWRGEAAYAGLEDCAMVAAEASRLAELRLAALEARIRADLDRGATRGLIGELAGLNERHPVNESFWALTLEALAASGRTADALAAYRTARDLLVSELGLEPGPALRAAHQRVLVRAPADSHPPAPGRAGERRRVTAVVVAVPDPGRGDDPEDLALAVARTRGAVESAARGLGAVIQPLSGAQFAVAFSVTFGADRSHGDDPQRAVHLAGRLAERGCAVGVATGVAIVGETGAEPQGVVLGRAAALATTAGQVHLDETTRDLAERPGVSLVAPVLVGRETEVAELHQWLREVTRHRRAQVGVVEAEPGVGKTRLLTAWRAEVLGAGIPCSVAQCDAYGERSAVAPLAGVVSAEDNAAAARLTGTAEVMAHWVGALTRMAASVPHVLIVEDGHWASDLLLDVLEALAADPPDVPLLVVVSTRPEVAERRPGWPNPPGARTLPLPELGVEETRGLVTALLAGSGSTEADREGIVQASGGVPLFAVEFAAMVRAGGRPGEAPPRLSDVVEARLDTLLPRTRSILARAALLGAAFSAAALAEVAEIEDAEVEAVLAELRARQFVRPAESPAPLPAFRFTHDLVRDAAYGRLLRVDRAALHLGAARWWSGRPGGVDLAAEHAWTAYALAMQTGRPALVEQARDFAADAVSTAARTARGVDTAAAITLAQRAATVLAGTEAEAVALTEYAEALTEHREFERALAPLGRAFELFGRGDDPGRVDAAILQTQLDFAVGAPLGAHDHLLHELIEDLEPGPGRVRCRGCLAVLQIIRQTPAAFRRAIELAEKTLAEAEQTHCPDAALLAYPARGRARLALGDERGLADMEYFQEHGPQHEKPFFILGARQWFAGAAHHWSGPTAELRLRLELEDYADRTGMAFLVSFGIAERLRCLWELGRHEECVREADKVDPGSDAMTRWVVVQRALALHDLGRLDEATLDAVRATPPADDSDLRHVIGSAWLLARVAADRGDRATAVGLLDGLGDLAAYASRDGAVEFLPRVLRLRAELGLPIAGDAFDAVTFEPTPLGRALAATIAGLVATGTERVAHLAAAVEAWAVLGESVDHDLARADLASAT